MSTLLDFFKFMRDGQRQNRPLDGDNCVVERTPNGTIINFISTDEADEQNLSEYSGFFLIEKIDDTSIKVNIGQSLINDSIFSIDKKTFIVADTETIYFEIEYSPAVFDEFGKIKKEGFLSTPEIKMGEFPEYNDSKFAFIIGEIEFSDNKITNIIQEQHGMIIGYVYKKIKDDCNTEGGSGGSRGTLAIPYPGSGNTPPDAPPNPPQLDPETDGDSTTTDPQPNDDEWYNPPKGERETDGGITPDENAPPAKKKRPLKDGSQEKNTQEVACSTGSCSDDKECVSVGSAESFRGQKDYIDWMINNISSQSIMDAKCKSVSTSFTGSCGSNITVNQDSIDGTEWVLEFTYCCCKKNEDDNEPELTDCSEGANNCAAGSLGCVESTSGISALYGSYSSCIEGQNGLLSLDGLNAVCDNRETAEAPTGCGYTNLTPCAYDDLVELFRFTYTACCCKLSECPPSQGLIDWNKGFGSSLSASFTNGTKCSDLLVFFQQSVGISSSGDGGTLTISSPSYNYSDSKSCGEGSVTAPNGLSVALLPGQTCTITASTNCEGATARLLGRYDARLSIS